MILGKLIVVILIVGIDIVDADVMGQLQEGVIEQCRRKCNSTLITQINNNFNIRCNDSCKVDKCLEGCDLLRDALSIPCQDLCNGTVHHVPDKALYCMMGCHSALNVYMRTVEDRIGVPAAPVLDAGSQTNVSITLRWQNSSITNITYLVQWKYEALPGDWEYYRPTAALHQPECLVTGLHPYTKYKFRIAWIVLKQHNPLISEESVVISTLAYGVPAGAPVLSLSAIDPSRILVSWDPPLFCNGPVLSYAVSLKNLANGHSLVKDISNQNAERFYLFNGLNPDVSYRVSVLARNSMGEGPSETGIIRTPAIDKVLKNDDNPYLVLGAKHHVIRQGIDLFEEAEIIYQSKNATDFIRGVALHVKNKLVFLSDSMGYVYSVSLEGNSEPKSLLKPLTHNWHPSILSVDWLYNKLYLVDGRRIARCNTDGTGYENVVVSLPSEPTEMKVDPYNGFLFWILENHNKFHLYKVDLSDLESDPLTLNDTKLIFSEHHLIAFAADHSSLQLLLPSQVKNTVVAVSLDGLEVTDIRQNTQQPKFNNVKSLVVHHGLLFWTTGQEVIGEEHQSDEDKYYHNSYSMLTSQKPFVGLNVLHPDSQPYPVPLNPVRQLEVVFDVNECRISWRPPKLLRGIGLGSWQKWNYQLQISDDNKQEILHVFNITSLHYTARNLTGNVTFYIKVRAYSDGGKGPWSEEFKGRTLREGNQNGYPFMLWSSRQGILKSNMLATVVEPFISSKLLHQIHVDDFAWYEDLLFLNTNSNHILVYNATLRHPPKRILSINSAHSLAVDCFAKKLYWSNPYPQVISRSNFDGSQQEPLPIPAVAKELNVDSASGYLYWTTMCSVECARLNGVQRQVYFQAGFFAGKQVLGLTVDRDHYQVFWMVRSQEGAQLFKGTMAGYTDANLKDTVQEVAILQEDIM